MTTITIPPAEGEIVLVDPEGNVIGRIRDGALCIDQPIPDDLDETLRAIVQAYQVIMRP